MATVTYYDLKEKGRILQAEDLLTLHGIQYRVVKPTFHYWLSTTGESAGAFNDAIFDILNLDKSEFLSKLFGDSSSYEGVFPAMDSAEKLTKLVIALYEQPMFHPGDTIKIANYKEGTFYPFGCTDYMKKCSGDQYFVKAVDTSSEIHSYTLEGIGYIWSENQFILVNRASEVSKDTVKEKDMQNADTTSTNYVTLDMLKAGYVFKKPDHIRIGRLDCIIRHRYEFCDQHRYWLSVEGTSENTIYDELGISIEEKIAIAREYGATDTCYQSPEFDSLENLSKFVLMLLEYNKVPEDNSMKEVTYKKEEINPVVAAVDFDSKVKLISKYRDEIAAINLPFKEPKEPISILPKKIKTNIIL